MPGGIGTLDQAIWRMSTMEINGREMSQTVQFIYISHNKIAMEMASQLTGVTMFEPGVSRMVAVDIDEAIAMAELE